MRELHHPSLVSVTSSSNILNKSENARRHLSSYNKDLIFQVHLYKKYDERRPMCLPASTSNDSQVHFATWQE
jgi:hypothetical protein